MNKQKQRCSKILKNNNQCRNQVYGREFCRRHMNKLRIEYGNEWPVVTVSGQKLTKDQTAYEPSLDLDFLNEREPNPDLTKVCTHWSCSILMLLLLHRKATNIYIG